MKHIRYEYKVVNTLHSGCPLAGPNELPWYERVQAGLNELGDRGWLLVGVSMTTLVFARPLYRDDKPGEAP